MYANLLYSEGQGVEQVEGMVSMVGPSYCWLAFRPNSDAIVDPAYLLLGEKRETNPVKLRSFVKLVIKEIAWRITVSNFIDGGLSNETKIMALKQFSALSCHNSI